MKREIKLPFKAGQLAEVKTFEEGYRSAWFRCKMGKITRKKGELGSVLEYIDFPDEESTWTNLYSESPFHYEWNTKGKHEELMVRPPYPAICSEKDILPASEVSEVTVVVCDSWRVGDMVDWFNHDCFWSGKITELLGGDEAQIELIPKPHGEGEFYNVLCKDLRPLLDWSPELGWTLPTSEGDFGRLCARLVKPIYEESLILDEDSCDAGQETESGLSISLPLSSNSASLDEAKSLMSTETNTSFRKRVPKKRKERTVDGNTRKTSQAVSGSGSEPTAQITQEEPIFHYCQKMFGGSGRRVLHSKISNCPEAAILDLEEYVNKIKWLKSLLHHGISSSDNQGPQWEFVG